MKIPKMLKLSRKKLIILAVIFILAILGFNLFGRKKEALLQFAAVKRQEIKSTVSSSGNLTGKEVANLKFKSSGKLAYINIKARDNVTAGQVIAGLDTQALSIALQQAQNTLKDKQATVDKIHDDVKGHDADETFTQRQTRTTAEVAANNAYDGVKETQRAFQDVALVSPISGIITQVNFIAGQNIGTSDVIVQVVDNSKIYFDTNIDEADIGKVSVGQKVEVTLDSYQNQTFKGIVDQVQPQTKTTSTGATVILIRILIDSPKITFINGLSGQASIIISESENALTIPQEALREDNTMVVRHNQSLSSKKVTPGIHSDTDVEIKEGLKMGEEVVLNPPAEGTGINQNMNPIQGMIFRIFGGGRGGASGRR